VSLDGDEFKDLRYQVPGEIAALRALFGHLRLRHVELHHFLGHSGRLIDELLALGIACDIYVHDNSWVCPRLTLVGGDGRYCGEPDLAGCENCIETYGSRLNEKLSTAELRRRSARWLAQARDVVVPSGDMARRLRRYFPGLTPRIKPWEAEIEPAPRPPTRPRSAKRIAVIGAIGQHKGYDVVLACARDAAARALPLEFVVIGYTQDDEALLETGKAFVTGEYEESEIAHLLRREEPEVAFFPSVAPESWCYALSHALRAGLPVIAFDLGAIAERLRALDLGKVVPMTTQTTQLNDLLLAEAWDMPANGSMQGRATSADGKFSSSPAAAALSPSASVQVVTVPEGLYAFRVRTGLPERTKDPEGLLLPAVNIGLAPGQPAGIIEFIAGPGTDGNWLCAPGQALVARVSSRPATLLLTSLRGPDGPPLSIVIDRLDEPNQAALDAAQRLELPAQPPAVDLSALPPALARMPANAASANAASANGAAAGAEMRPHGVRSEIVAHIQRRGDIRFADAGWAGHIGQRLWIEAFTINPLEAIAADQLEYKGLTAAGYETPWVSNGALCGTRGMAMPLVGFAVRCKPGDDAKVYDCQYRGAFFSGAIIGPRRNGAPCFSTPDDPLEAIELQITPQAPSRATANADAETRRGAVTAAAQPRPPGAQRSAARNNARAAAK
jgi:glycosyltransferase involved in cell wall biosynthesis